MNLHENEEQPSISVKVVKGIDLLPHCSKSKANLYCKVWIHTLPEVSVIHNSKINLANSIKRSSKKSHKINETTDILKIKTNEATDLLKRQTTGATDILKSVFDTFATEKTNSDKTNSDKTNIERHSSSASSDLDLKGFLRRENSEKKKFYKHFERCII